jgi:anti-anti-sigma regulatory factor
VQITTRDANDVKVVQIEGELDTGSSPEAQQQLDQLRKQDGGDLRVCSLNESVKEVFDISGFSTLLMVLDDETKALSGF